MASQPLRARGRRFCAAKHPNHHAAVQSLWQQVFADKSTKSTVLLYQQLTKIINDRISNVGIFDASVIRRVLEEIVQQKPSSSQS